MVLAETVAAAARAGVDLLQIREKRLSARSLSELVDLAVSVARGSTLGIMVNDRADVAVSCGAAGVHLTSSSLRPDVVRGIFGEALLIGYSAHCEDELLEARGQGADYCFFSPIFETSSKIGYGPPHGVERLRSAVVRAEGFPVLALGGINEQNVDSVLCTGAGGVAAINMFKDLSRLPELIAQIKSHRSNQ